MATHEPQIEDPTVAVEESIESQFTRLADEWRRESQFLSSSTDIAMLWPYQRIISLGRASVPLILKELNQDSDHWFWALHAITGHDPVKPEDSGHIDKMAEAWLTWGRENGIEF